MASQEPISAAQLQVARSAAWHQTGDPILTLEAARDWLMPFGLVLFAPRAQQLGAPAPSFVEATLGAANEAPSLAQTETARSLAARLVAEGHAVPLNLLGGPGDVPDFLASAQVFSFLYTLRGDKLWKQAPDTSGANKVTPLSLSVYEMLAERGALSAADLATELGRELTESAIARALSELWQHMRVIPLLQQGEGATMWELTTRRFTKTIKAGTNAGQPTALSALVSLYLAQALLASEEEVAAFLSPVAARSRIREVLHALVGARELSEHVIDGKTLMHIPGALPEFAEITEPVEAEAGEGTETLEEGASTESGERIKRFAPRDGELDSSAFRGKSSAGPGYRSRPAGGGFRKSAGTGEGERRSPRPRPEGAPSDRERRPFRRDAAATPRPERSQYAKPWDEDRKPRAENSESSENAASAEGDTRPPRTGDAGSERPFRAKPFGDRKPSGDRKPFGDRKSFGDRKPFGERKPYVPRESREGQGGEDRPRRSFSSSSDRPARAPRADRPEGARPFRPRTDAAPGSRPYRPRTESGSGDRPYRPRTEGSSDRPYRPRPAGDGEARPRRDASERPNRGPGFSRPPGGAGRPPREGGFRPTGRPSGGGDRPPFRRREEGEGSERPRRTFSDSGDRPARPRRDFGGDGDASARPRPSGERAPFGERKGPSRAGSKPFGRPSGPGRPSSSRPGTGSPGSRPSFGGRPAGKSAGKRPFSKGPAKGAGGARSTRPAGDRPPRRPRSEE